MGAVLRLIWLEGWAIGDTAARAVLTDAEASWSWAEGDAEAALRALPEESRAAAEGWTAAATQWLQSITAGRLRTVAEAMASGLASGLSARQLATSLRTVLRDPVWAGTVALTELVRASTAAATAAYRQAGAASVQWHAEDDERTCQVCLTNEAQDPMPIGSMWPDGSTAPPAHPRCRCWLAPT